MNHTLIIYFCPPTTPFLHAFNFSVFLSFLCMSAPLRAIYLEGCYLLLLSFLRTIGLNLSPLPAATKMASAIDL
jgi:hypothetical protein